LVERANVHPSASVSPTAVLGAPYRPLRTGTTIAARPCTIAERCYVGHYTIIGAGTFIGQNTIIDDFVKIECDVKVAESCLLIYRATICNDCSIASNTVVGGFLTERVKVGSNCRIFGQVVHKHLSMALDWDDDAAREQSAVIEDDVLIAFSAMVVGGITVGKGSVVTANSVVTRDVPPNTVVRGTDQHFPKRG
jgi:acetyltransferase-like isoleucine patch superfamily enzyme